MRRIKLTREEKEIEAALERGEYTHASKEEFEEMARALEQHRKDSVLNMRINSEVLRLIKEKARKRGIKYQTLISEFLSRLAHS